MDQTYTCPLLRYGEQVLVLLQSVANCGGLDCSQYAASFAQAFQDTNGGYRDVSTKGFLANHFQGLQPPFTGAKDAQANCIVRCPPLVAGWAGNPGLFPAVQRATRVTQNSTVACIWACAAAAILEAVVLTGCSPSQAVAAVAAELQQVNELRQSKQAPTASTEASQDAALLEPESAALPELQPAAAPITPGAAEHRARSTSSQPVAEIADRVHRFAFAGAMATQVSAHLSEAASLAALTPSSAVAQLGRNCHMPNALQTPLHIALHLEHRLREHLALSPAAWDASAAASLGHLYAAGVRLAISEGGCCASRAAYLGALLGASVGNKDGVIPRDWAVKYRQYDAVFKHARMICQTRFSAEAKDAAEGL
ncbi:ADP-ribosylation/Crystallin J1 [Dunaliella salina]|uniref:ADP-ribosylation/Crystallin J1 n=1 Tax=Dunaliella salina TaxID=3046 RepID=A0ABQ7GBJ8_DUNSA|nr:ADP-ribosylation/Crystallin J1 [Dunaliella salina]|eukprot:KAF5831978.1 ADP-ribosylation/Crystallin J1 [Dunaliella salina]